MSGLAPALEALCRGATAFVGVGNTDRGDDGAGVALARRLRAHGIAHVFDGAIAPERHLAALRDGSFDTVVFLDAVDAGAEPGSIVLLDASAIAARYPMVSTHKLSLGLLARMTAGEGRPRVWLLGIQPDSIAMRPALSAVVENTVSALALQIADAVVASCRTIEEPVCT
jgi:hydrogenase maturation protease